MASIHFYLDPRRPRKDGSFPIKLYVYHKKKFLIGTNFSSTPENWNETEYSKKAPNYKARNIVLRNIINKVENMFLKLNEEGKLRSMTEESLKENIEDCIKEKKEARSLKFVDYLDKYVSSIANEGTRTVYNTTRNKIISFDAECTFDTMDKNWLTRFETLMAKTMKVNAYAIHFRNIRAIFNWAIDEEITTSYPFRKFKIKKEETRKRSLSVEQLIMLRDYPCEDYQVVYRDMFMLMFYLIGVNAADLFRAPKASITDGRFEYKRAKTGKLYSIKVEPEAMEIIKRYESKKSDYLLNVMDTYKDYKDFLHHMNDALKQIGEVQRKGLGGKKERKPLFPDLSSYWCRHTWATIASRLEIPIETISKALGHSYGCDTTAIYIAFDMKKVDEANRKVIDYVNNPEKNKEK